MTTPPLWLELSVRADTEAAESVAEVLARYGHNQGVVIESDCTPTEESDGWVGAPGLSPHAPPPTYTTNPEGPVTLRTYLPLNQHTEEIRQHLEQALWHLGQIRPVGPLQTRTLQEEDWANAWKSFYQIQHMGQHTVIVPSWLDYTPRPDDIVLSLDPGMAFGTGLHPTTQLCLQQLETLPCHNRTILDVGTGSGILSIAAAKMGAAHVLALDNDPVAVEVATANVAHNQVGERVHVALGSLGMATPDEQTTAPPQRYDLIVANIIASVLVALAPHLADALAPDGTLLTSGIILEREDEVALALAAAGLHLHQRHRQGDWVALHHCHTPPVEI